MDFPPLDDTRWDLLLGAVIEQRPAVADPDSPLATWFSSFVVHEQALQDEPEPWQRAVGVDAYA